MNKVINTQQRRVNTLNANDIFYLPGVSNAYVCESRRSEPGATAVTYRPVGSMERFTFIKPGLSTVHVVID